MKDNLRLALVVSLLSAVTPVHGMFRLSLVRGITMAARRGYVTSGPPGSGDTSYAEHLNFKLKVREEARKKRERENEKKRAALKAKGEGKKRKHAKSKPAFAGLARAFSTTSRSCLDHEQRMIPAVLREKKEERERERKAKERLQQIRKDNETDRRNQEAIRLLRIETGLKN